MKSIWEFPLSSGGVYNGFNDAGIENYTGDRYESLGREIVQNSLDATLNKGPVQVTIYTTKIQRTAFPDVENLTKHLEACLKESKQDPKPKHFFENALAILNSKNIPILRIDDHHTTGMLYEGADPKNTQFYAITKGRGLSKKSSEVSAGSYGIGQNAPFAVSDLRTVFYSTSYNNSENELREIFQGKAVLMSHDNGDGDTQGTGFYGEPKICGPIHDKKIPPFFRRSDKFENDDLTGSSIFIPGYIKETNWEFRVAAAIINNFFVAIDDSMLSVTIQNMIEINSKTLPEILVGKKYPELMSYGDVRVTASYYAAYKNEDPRSSQLSVLKHCKLWIMLSQNEISEKESIGKGVALVRSPGMFVTDRQAGLKQFSGKDFRAVFICQSESGNKLLRNMEPPRHDSFEPDRIDPKNKRIASRALQEMRDWIRGEVSKLIAPDQGEESDIIDLEEFLPDPNPDEGLPGEKKKTEKDFDGNPKRVLTPLKRIVARPSTAGEKSNYGSEEGLGAGGKGHGVKSTTEKGGVGEAGGEMKGSKGGRSLTNARIEKVRFLNKSRNKKKKIIHFTPQLTGVIAFTVQSAGDTDFEKLSIIKSSKGTAKNGVVEGIEVQEGNRVTIQIELSDSYEGAIKVTAYEI
ncbi:MAG: hypothetical protein HN757_17350 [Calditrichaeota bacterium]|nr:hypothetical protein [Calditrichota bacterium]